MSAVLHHGESLAYMRTMPDASVDLIATDPPYFKVKPNGWDRQWSTSRGFLDWAGACMDEMQRILKPNGSLYWFCSPQMTHGLETEVRKRFDLLNNIRWVKAEGRQKQQCKEDQRKYWPNYETVLFAEQRNAEGFAKGESRYSSECEKLRGFVFEPIRKYLADEWSRAGLTVKDANEATGTQMAGHWFTASQWQLPTPKHYAALRARASGDYLRREYEDLRREYEDLRREYEDLRRPFAVSANVQYVDTWTFKTVGAYKGKHPCEKPQEMMEHIVRASSKPGAVVFDPFMGSGSTGAAAISLGRSFIGCEMEEHSFRFASGRIARQRASAAVDEPAEQLVAVSGPVQLWLFR